MIHPVTEADRELAAVASPEGRIIVGVDDSPSALAALRGIATMSGRTRTPVSRAGPHPGAAARMRSTSE